jgi:hypothetical protein
MQQNAISTDLTIYDFVEGFEYQMKSTFGDGTVKTKQQYDDAEWIDCVYYEGERPYIERMLNGKNAMNGLLGLRRMSA